METSLQDIDDELNNMELVFSKLALKQNEVVYEKLCEKSDSLANRIKYLCNENKGLAFKFLSVLKRLLSFCMNLRNYRDYLDDINTNTDNNSYTNTNVKKKVLVNNNVTE